MEKIGKALCQQCSVMICTRPAAKAQQRFIKLAAHWNRWLLTRNGSRAQQQKRAQQPFFKFHQIPMFQRVGDNVDSATQPPFTHIPPFPSPCLDLSPT